MSYKDKFVQMDKEARASLIGVLITLAWFWIIPVALNGSGKTIAGMPAWYVVGAFGTFIVSIIVSIVLAKFVFVDFELDEDEADAPKVAKEVQ